MQTAVILAAGMGTRLRGEIRGQPKGLLCLGEKPIVEESIELLVGAGIRYVVVVTGYRATEYEALAERYGELVRTIHNPLYADSGSMYSLYCARAALPDSFLLLESDLIYEPRALTALLAHPGADAVLLAGASDAGDEVYVSTQDGYLLDMSKNPQALEGPIAGELVGICKISSELMAHMVRIAEAAFTESLHFDYETDCLVAAARQRRIPCVIVPDLVWSEIDDPHHLRRARDGIYREIRGRITAGG